MKKSELSLVTVAIVTALTMSGCGFKSDLYLSDRAPDSLPDVSELPSLPTLDELNNPGVPVAIPPLEETAEQENKKTK